MLCKNPVSVRNARYPCGQCMPCRFNKRRTWTHRMMLEAMKHHDNSFLTLTYDAEHLPTGGTLVPRDVTLFIKRFRETLRRDYGQSLRYFLVGEYGDESWRPHYHAALFGVGTQFADLIREQWGKGHVMLGDLTTHSAQYIAGYCTKKMTSKNDPRLQGRHPEFTRMSRNPGLGADAAADIASSLMNKPGWDFIEKTGDVPASLHHGGKSLPLGRYMRRKLREALSFENIGGQDRPASEIQKDLELFLLQPDLYFSQKSEEAEKIERERPVRVRQLEAKAKLYQQRKSL